MKFAHSQARTHTIDRIHLRLFVHMFLVYEVCVCVCVWKQSALHARRLFIGLSNIIHNTHRQILRARACSLFGGDRHRDFTPCSHDVW